MWSGWASFPSPVGSPLQLIDCQNLFCETDKYARVAHPEVQGISGRTRIKQTYRPKSNPISLWYPPEWGINEAVKATHEKRAGNNHPSGGPTRGTENGQARKKGSAKRQPRLYRPSTSVAARVEP